VDEIITTRRLVNIATAFSIFGDRRRSIEMAISRFDNATKEAFLSMYEKIDAEVRTDDTPVATEEATTTGNECPF